MLKLSQKFPIVFVNGIARITFMSASPQKVCHIIVFFLVALGVFARLYLYINHKEMWGDEFALAAAIYKNNFVDILIGNLIYNQSAPLIFLLLTKLLSVPFGTSELVLYFFPFISSLFLFYL
ncbi:hypothetical protein AGMMS49938_11300 [Fibrobacterales bacterium]|nr:hypothetical protein AGMMS49938_11300 [Fibrobacterales bacterium]